MNLKHFHFPSALMARRPLQLTVLRGIATLIALAVIYMTYHNLIIRDHGDASVFGARRDVRPRVMLVVMVFSAAKGSTARRQAIRETWGRYASELVE